MHVNRLYLDSNVLITLGEGTGEAAELLTELVGWQEPAETPFLRTSELSLAELLVHPYRQNDERLIEQYDNWLVSLGFMEVGPVHRSALWYAAVLRANYPTLKLADAIHLSTAIGFKCSHVLSADRRLPDEVVLVHRRHGSTRRAPPLSIIRPTTEVLLELLQSQRPS